MPYTTKEDVKSRAIFKGELALLDDSDLDYLIQRASMMLENEVGITFRDSTDADILFKLNFANVYLVDRLYFLTQVEVAESALGNISSEDLMNASYSVSKGQTQLMIEFEKEYAMTVASLQSINTVGFNIFSIGRGASSGGDRSCE